MNDKRINDNAANEKRQARTVSLQSSAPKDTSATQHNSDAKLPEITSNAEEQRVRDDTSIKSPLPKPATVTHPWLALAFLALSVSLIVVDGTIVNVALPTMIRELHLNFSQAEWITTIYALIFSALLITMGRLADSLGRKTILLIGIVLFVGASILAGASTTSSTLLTARALQGIGGATVLPTTLSTVNSIFQGKQRAIAFAVWGSVISGMAALGPLLGGFLTTYFSWPWIFYINVPLGVIIVIGAIFFVPNTYGEKRGRGLDVDGFLLSSIGLGALVYGLIEGRSLGWWTPTDPDSLLPISLAAIAIMTGTVFLIGFFLWERHRRSYKRSRLVNIELFRIRSFFFGNIAAGAIAIGEFGLLFILPLYLQNVRELSALEAGYVLATMALGAFIAGGLAGPFAQATHPVTVARSGLALEILALIVLGFILDAHTSIFIASAILVVYGFGLGLASAQLTSLVLADIPVQNSGQGSAIQSTVRQIGSALGIAIVATFLAISVNMHTDNSLADLSINPTVARSIEHSVADSAGSSLIALHHGVGDFSAFEPSLRSSMAQALDHGFALGSGQAIIMSTVFIGIGFLATLALPKPQQSLKTTA
ncbi:MAG: MFS transporter [Actinomycetaceae bacterium]|nr:MFS transporter [Actinomycetaceae bacterium]